MNTTTVELSPRLKVKNLKPGQIKVFKLINVGKIDPTSNKAYRPAGAEYIGEFTIFDQFEKEDHKQLKVIRNVISRRPIVKPDGSQHVEEVVAPVEFDKTGFCIVHPDQYNLLVCLTRANENASNPFRKKSVPALWEEVQPTKTMIDNFQNLDMALDAERIVIGLSMQDLQVMSKKLGAWTATKSSDALRYDLRILARSNPKEIIRCGTDRKLQMEIYVADAILANAIDFEEDTKRWIWSYEEEGKNIILTVGLGKEPKSELVNFLAGNKDASKKLIAFLNVKEEQVAA